MNDLIAALLILAKYQEDTNYPTHCVHETLMVVGIDRDKVTDEDLERLQALDFEWDSDYDTFVSYRFGAA